MKEWFYLIGEKKYGPFQSNDLKGQINKNTLVWSKGMPEWEKAGNLPELQFIFNPIESSSPPPPPINNNKNTISEKLSNGITYSWFLVILSIIAAILEMAGKDESKIYGLIMFLTLTSLIRVLISVKTYFKNILNFNKTNVNINWLIATYIPLYLITTFTISRMSKISDGILALLFIIMILSGIINIYHTIKFYFKLNNISGYGIKYFQRFVGLLISLFIVSIIHGVTIPDKSSIVIPILEVLSYVFLLLGFYEIRKNIK